METVQRKQSVNLVTTFFLNVLIFRTTKCTKNDQLIWVNTGTGGQICDRGICVHTIV